MATYPQKFTWGLGSQIHFLCADSRYWEQKVVSATSVRVTETLNHLDHYYAVPRDTFSLSHIFSLSKLFPNKPRNSEHLNFSPFLHPHQGLQFYLDIQSSSLQTFFTQLKKTKRERICICNVGITWLNFLLTTFISHPDLQLSLVTVSGVFWHTFLKALNHNLVVLWMTALWPVSFGLFLCWNSLQVLSCLPFPSTMDTYNH